MNHVACAMLDLSVRSRLLAMAKSGIKLAISPPVLAPRPQLDEFYVNGLFHGRIKAAQNIRLPNESRSDAASTVSLPRMDVASLSPNGSSINHSGPVYSALHTPSVVEGPCKPCETMNGGASVAFKSPLYMSQALPHGFGVLFQSFSRS